jgi:hypothetical protein
MGMTGKIKNIIKHLNIRFILQVLLVMLVSQGFNASANVRPGYLSDKSFPADPANFKDYLPRNFSSNSDLPKNAPFPANHGQAARPLPNEEKCYVQEAFTLLAEKGHENAIHVFTGYITENILDQYQSFIYNSDALIISWYAHSARIRPPPSF